MFKTILAGFEPLKQANFRTYILGQAVSLIGTWLQVTAQSWVVWELTKSEASLGMVAMLNALPTLFLSPWAGVLADRLNRQKLLIFTQVGLMLLAALLAYLVQFGLVNIWQVYVLSFIGGIFGTLDFPTQSAFLGDLAGLSNVRKAVNMNAMFFQASRMIGPALAGWIIATWGTAAAFWLNSISFLVVIASILMVRVAKVEHKVRTNTILQDLREGIVYLAKQPRMQDLLFLSITITAFALSLFSVMPAFAAEQLGGDAKTLGLLMAASGAGALVSVIVISPVVQSLQRVGRSMLLSLVWSGVWIILFSRSTTVPLAMVCLFFLSFSLPLIIAMSLGLIQILAPAEMRARLLSLFTMISFGLQPISSIIVGNLSEYLGVAVTALINGSLVLLVVACLAFFRDGLWNWQHQPHKA